jgi:hypothetical protein
VVEIACVLIVRRKYKKLLQASKNNDINIFGNCSLERLAEMFGKHPTKETAKPNKHQDESMKDCLAGLFGKNSKGAAKDKPPKSDVETLEMSLKQILKNAASVIKKHSSWFRALVNFEMDYLTYIETEKSDVPGEGKPDFLEP